jgi:hypothetical protein
MYPHTYYETFMRYEASDEVFVAVPFSKEFTRAIDEVIAPAIGQVLVNGKPLKARVVNRGTAGAVDIHEQIYDGIIHSRLVIADMTVQSSYTLDDGKTRWQANANVAYEVGLAAAWRNSEDILLIHQPHREHSYSFDVQNLRHVGYDLANVKSSIDLIREEVIGALRRSRFLADQTFASLATALTPAAIHFMHSEVVRCFPVVGFNDRHGMSFVDMRVEGATDLLRIRALKIRNTILAETGQSFVYQWTELGFRLMRSWRILSAEREAEMRAQIASVPVDELPPKTLLTHLLRATCSGENSRAQHAVIAVRPCSIDNG